MGSYYTLLLIIPVAIVFLLVRYFIGKTNGNAVPLFKAALKEENAGRFEAAIIQYELALHEAERKGFDKSLRILIMEKLKVLHTITEYQREMYIHPKTYKIAPAAKM